MAAPSRPPGRPVSLALAAAVTALALACPSTPALAQPIHDRGTIESADRGDVGPRMLNFRVSLFTGVPDVMSVSASLTRLRPFELEAGVYTFLFGTGAYARAGLAVKLHDARAESGWTWDLLVLGQYRYMETIPFDTAHTAHGAGGNLGVDGTLWVLPRFGVHFHLVAGAVYWVSHTNPNAPPVVPDVRIAAGIAF